MSFLEVSEYQLERDQMDYEWFPRYPPCRVQLQDAIARRMLVGVNPSLHRKALFTCGVYGSSKTHSMRNELAQPFSVATYTLIDPDAIRHELPEWSALVQEDPLTAGDKTHKEATFIALLVERVCLTRGVSYIVDGSLANADWYEEWFKHVTLQGFSIFLLKFTCTTRLAAQRCQKRAKQTGRTIPIERLESVAQTIHFSWQRLKTMAVAWWEFDTSGDKAALLATGSNA